MNRSSSSPDDALAHASREEILSALFSNMVVQHTNMALIFLGRVPHPETGEHVFDLETAQMFIDQLEMLEIKTKGNLSRQEEALLKQGLAATRMAFVEGIERAGGTARSPLAGSRGPASRPEPPAPAPEPAMDSKPPADARPAAAPADTSASSLASGPPAEAESRKKFTKKY